MDGRGFVLCKLAETFPIFLCILSPQKKEFTPFFLFFVV